MRGSAKGTTLGRRPGRARERGPACHAGGVSTPDDATTTKVLVGITLADTYRAQELLTAATRLGANGKLSLLDAVIVVKDENGHTHVHETVDPTIGHTAFSGAIWAGLFGLLLGGPVGWLAGTAVGAGAGAVTAKLVDLGIPDEWVAWFREAVRPGTTTLALLVADLDAEALVAEARRFSGAELIYADLDDETIDRISAAFGSPSPPPERRRDVATRHAEHDEHPDPTAAGSAPAEGTPASWPPPDQHPH